MGFGDKFKGLATFGKKALQKTFAFGKKAADVAGKAARWGIANGNTILGIAEALPFGIGNTIKAVDGPLHKAVDRAHDLNKLSQGVRALSYIGERAVGQPQDSLERAPPPGPR